MKTMNSSLAALSVLGIFASASAIAGSGSENITVSYGASSENVNMTDTFASLAISEQSAEDYAAYFATIAATDAIPSPALNATLTLTVSGNITFNGSSYSVSGTEAVHAVYCKNSTQPDQCDAAHQNAIIWDNTTVTSSALNFQMPAGLYQLPDGQVYYVNGAGHTCYDTAATTGTPVSIIQGQILDGVCGSGGTYSPAYQAVDHVCFADLQTLGCGPAGTGLTACLNNPSKASRVTSACRAGLMNFFVNANGYQLATVVADYSNLFPASSEGLYSAPLLAVDMACESDLVSEPTSPLAGQGLTAWLNANDRSVSQSCLSGLEAYFNLTAAELKASYPNL